MGKAKSFSISKRVVWRAYEWVKANGGAAGVDEEEIPDFERNLKGNLYKIWNRMSSGTYFPPPVRTVPILKAHGGTRYLGIPTVGDRIAQAVVKMYLEPEVEPHFHRDSYGYRPRRSALDAIGCARQRCWRFNWVLDLDIKGFFDNLDHDLLMRAVRKFTNSRWILLYVERWLKAPATQADGKLVSRGRGTPQGGVISPLLANIFLHLVFDEWMRKGNPNVLFERYADDIIIHCRTQEEAITLLDRIKRRLQICKLELHPKKTKIVYCKDANRQGGFSQISFTFLGYTFRPRLAKSRSGAYFVSFIPAISPDAAVKIRKVMRGWRFHLRNDKALEDLSRMFNPIIRGWINYYGRFYPSALFPIFKQLNCAQVKWVRRKYKRMKQRPRQAEYWLGRVALRQPQLFAHWQHGVRPVAGG